jgi:hypothetical protein
MSWLKDAWIDVTVTIVIILATMADLEWARWAIRIYTPLMLVLWLSTYLRRYAQSKIKSKKTSVPPAVHHVLYGADVLFTAYDRWWWIAGCWALIWILSAATSRATDRPA